jgi:hypothetical protein
MSVLAGPWLLVLVELGITATAAAQNQCCVCRSSSRTFQIQQATGCDIGCSASGGVATGTAACYTNGTTSSGALGPDNYSDYTVIGEIDYAVYHQGANVWRSSGMLQGEELKKALTGVDGKLPAISNTSISRLERLVPIALKGCVSDRNIDKDMEWVCYHEGQGGDIHNRTDQGNFDAVRSVFSNHEKHDDNLRNRIYCRSNEELKTLVAQHCPIYVPPPPRKPTSSKEEFKDSKFGPSGRN